MKFFDKWNRKAYLAVFLGLAISVQLFGVRLVQAAEAEDAQAMNVEMTSEERQETDTAETNGNESKTTAEAPETNAEAEGPQVSAPSALLMEVSTGTVIYEKDADTARPPASVTKVMTMLLIFDALDAGKINLSDQVSVSEFAASMGGSQVYLEPGETQTVETMLKCISIASANDACVAMAEYICGSEEEFVRQMNERAKGLGMSNTHFVNCNGLDTDGHVTTARDIALMSKELITKYPQIHDYCTIWMENITHTTKKGTSEFGLTNTNKLIRQYEYATGLKTGSTGLAKFCVSATAKKDDVELIAVIMAAEDSKSRFKDATTLFGYGFGKCQIYRDETPPKLEKLGIEGGVREEIEIVYKNTFSYLDTSGGNLSQITAKIELPESLPAPIKEGDVVGRLVYEWNGTEVGNVDIVAAETVEKAKFVDFLKKVLGNMRT